MIKIVTELIKRNGVYYFNEFLETLFTDLCYKEFVTSVISFVIIYKNRFLIIQGVSLALIDKFFEDNQNTLCDSVNGKHDTTVNNLLDLIETKPPEFHNSLFKLLIFDKSHINLLKSLFKNIDKQQLSLIFNVIKSLPQSEYSETLSVLKVYAKNNMDDIQDNSSSLPPSPAYKSEVDSLCTSNHDDFKSNTEKFFDRVKNHLDSKPTHKELACHVIPYCATQWKILGDILGIPCHKIASISKNCHHIVEDCCRELLHTWLQKDAEASWNTLLSALNSPTICFNLSKDTCSPFGLYKNHLRSAYKNHRTLTNEDWPPTLHNNFIDLRVARVPKEIRRELDTGLLFHHEKKDYEMEILDSYEQIFQFQDSGHHVVVIEGDPGSGKTTISFKICKDWADDIVLKHISIIVLLILRDPRIGNAVTLEELVSVGLGLRTHTEQICSYLTSSHGKNAILWLEGWDELEYSKRSNSIRIC